MKTALALSGTLLLLFTGLLHAEEEAPAVRIREALTVAEKSLADKGVADRVYVQSVNLITASITGHRSIWEVLWSGPITGSRPGSVEVGLQIKMNGDVVHLLKGAALYHKPSNAH